ncbi:MAG: hypothetical protein J2P36_05135, partial [Ktedonobacteraceae bacterium]|nr:hypothetical protein [Ktedonobacteraceae bacterium]
AVQVLIIICVLLWGIVSWFLGAPINSYLVSLEPGATAVALSLNQTALYLGISAAAVVGGVALSFGVEYLGFAGALISFVAFCLLMANRGSRAEVPPAQPAQTSLKSSTPGNV